MTLPSKQSKRNTSNRLRQSKQVRFCPRVLARRSLCLSEYTKDEMKACWYTADEYSRIRRGVMKTVERMELEDNLCEGDGDICMRGLECRTSQGAKLRLHNRLCAFDAVFREQDLQFREYRCDDNEIASSYMTATLPSKAQAYMMGLSDQNHIVCCTAASLSSPSSWPLSTSCGSAMKCSSCNNNTVVLPPLSLMNNRMSASPPAWAA